MSLYDNNNSDVVTDVLYTPQFQDYIIKFCNLTSQEVSVATLAPIIELLRQSHILSMLLANPQHGNANVCLQRYVDSNPYIPKQFIPKFISLANVKVSLIPSGVNYISRSYTAKVINNNVPPLTDVVNFTIKTRQDQLRTEGKNLMICKSTEFPITQTVKLPLTNDLLTQCINTIGDLNQTIHEGNRMNGYKVDEFIKSNLTF